VLSHSRRQMCKASSVAELPRLCSRPLCASCKRLTLCLLLQTCVDACACVQVSDSHLSVAALTDEENLDKMRSVETAPLLKAVVVGKGADYTNYQGGSDGEPVMHQVRHTGNVQFQACTTCLVSRWGSCCVESALQYKHFNLGASCSKPLQLSTTKPPCGTQLVQSGLFSGCLHTSPGSHAHVWLWYAPLLLQAHVTRPP
jgi:hypothetical protein